MLMICTTVMDSGQRYSLWYALTPLVAGENIVLGTFSLRWKRYVTTLCITTLSETLRSLLLDRTPKAADRAADDDASVLIQEKMPPARIIRSPLKATLSTRC